MRYGSTGTFPLIKALLLSGPKTEVTICLLLLPSSDTFRFLAFHLKCGFGVEDSPDPVPHVWGIERQCWRAEWCSHVCGGWSGRPQMPSHPVLGGIFYFEPLLWPASWGLDIRAALMWQRGRKFTLLLILLPLIVQCASACLARERAFHGELVAGGICYQEQSRREMWQTVLSMERWCRPCSDTYMDALKRAIG